jgi:hypothetical protein
LKLWQGLWFAIVKKSVSSFSLALILVAFAIAEVDYVKVQRQLSASPTPKSKQAILRQLFETGEADDDLQNALSELVGAWDSGFQWSPTQVLEMIEVRALIERQPISAAGVRTLDQAKKIKSNPLYRDPGQQESSNWFSRAMTRLGELLSNVLNSLFGNRTQAPDAPDLTGLGAFFAAIGPALKLLVFLLLAGLLGLFIYFVARHFSWQRRLSRSASAILDDDEPERSRDEWLEMAAKLTAEGRYREAVRCLYLASLLRFDEAGVARFIRSETNWEHLRRIEQSPKLPAGLDFTEPTRSFDSIWYGFRIKGIEDVEWFRLWYGRVTDALANREAA